VLLGGGSNRSGCYFEESSLRKTEMLDLKNKKIAIFSHDNEGTTGTDDEIVRYVLKNGCNDIVNIKFPFIYSSDGAVRLKFIKNRKEALGKSLIKFYRPQSVAYLKDVVLGFFYGARYLKGFDIFFGMNNLLVFVGLLLKKLGFVKKVIYYIIDYTPIRYKNSFLNGIYYKIDRVALYGSDLVVSLNEEMLLRRVDDKKLDMKKINHIVAPYGNDSLSFEKEDYAHDKRVIVYFGGINKNKGSELFVPIVKSLIGKRFDNFVFKIIGGGDVEHLKNEIKNNGLEKYFSIVGRIEKQEDIDKLLLKCGVALAPYYPEDKNNFSYYSDPGKVKIYLGCGLPIVITNVPPIAKEIEKNNSGLIARYNPDDFADKLSKILENYEFYEENAIKFGKEFDWSDIFDNLFKKVTK
jgi:glycosyltransferase involved in cell wall biosynthesis